jgi:carbonic anhydrase
LSCIDSRTSAELVFDQGIGDIFSIRIAGNVLNGDILGSMEFACHVAGAKLIVVLGHSQCGAVRGACERVELGHLTGLLGNIRPAVDAVAKTAPSSSESASNAEFVEAVARENVTQSIDGIAKRSDVLSRMRDAGDIDIVGGMYDIASGSVEFF